LAVFFITIPILKKTFPLVLSRTVPNGPAADLPPPAATGFAQPPEARFNPLLAGGLGLAAGYYLVNRYIRKKLEFFLKSFFLKTVLG
jgi:hypothetical protein